MMRSESTSALGQPKLTKPILGEPILGEPILGGLIFDGEIGISALIGKRGTLVSTVCTLETAEHEGSGNAETCRQRAVGPRGSGLLATLVLGICADALGGIARAHLARGTRRRAPARTSRERKRRRKVSRPSAGGWRPRVGLALSGPAQFDVRTDCRGARAGKTWRQSPGVPLNTLRSTGFSIPGT